ncbi:hypothetical protein [Pilimelia columellifera]|uniref:LemA family protein n=1 Tax=Pilimelia columellifera subsp. columellifera TaxID=706583 RepID=A0ABP6AY75_9ACTN
MPDMLTLAVLTALALVALYLAWTAGRVDRLHARAQAAERALSAHLLRRAAAAAVLAERQAIPDLYAAARAALDAEADERGAAENDLTRELREAVDGAPDEAMRAVCRRAALARQMHTDLVRDALGARRRRLVRVLGLARRHECPAYFDIDDPALDVPVVELAPTPAPLAAPAAAAPR